MMGGQLQINCSTFYQGVYIGVYAVIIIRYGLTDWGSLTLELMSWFSGLITITIIGCAGLRLRSIARSSFLTLVWKKCFLLQPSFVRLLGLVGTLLVNQSYCSSVVSSSLCKGYGLIHWLFIDWYAQWSNYIKDLRLQEFKAVKS